MSIAIHVVLSDPRARLPEYKTAGSVGVDLAVLDDVTIAARDTLLVPTGLKVALPERHAGFVLERSSFNKRFGCSLTNKVGLVDFDYRGEIFLSIRNETQTEKTIPAGERVAQLVVVPVPVCSFVLVDDLEPTQRGAGGFGSTG